MKTQIKNRYSGAVIFECDGDLSSANLSSANLSSANLSSADLRSADLRSADLRYADLRSADLSSANLSSANLSSANLRSADLRSADLRSADLRYADLRSADLSYADLREATGLPYVPKIEKLDSKILAAIKGGGTLEMGGWHKCETTHCRAGWAITLAGEAGKVLESMLGPAVAGTLIYNAAYPGRKHPDFFTDNETAMADIEKCAADEVAS